MNLYDLIKHPVISEKTSQARFDNQIYTFCVDLSANKLQIKKAVEKIWDVKVEAVNTSILRLDSKRSLIPNKSKSTKLKKAMVKLHEGYTIDAFDM